MAENGEIAQAFAPQHRKLQAFMVTFSQHFRVLLENIFFFYSDVSLFSIKPNNFLGLNGHFSHYL
jgi:hypothetical protein